MTNTIVGAFVIMSLTNGMNLMGIDISIQYIVKGVIFIRPDMLLFIKKQRLVKSIDLLPSYELFSHN